VKAEGMLAEAKGGLVSRPEGFVIELSTQSDEPPAGVFKSRLDYFRQVRDGAIGGPQVDAGPVRFPDDMIRATFSWPSISMPRSARRCAPTVSRARNIGKTPPIRR